MSKNYKRHSHGKASFRGANFGDLGLRAYKEQQDAIINSLKLQNKEFESTRKEFIDSDILKSTKELENSKEIKKFQDKVWDVKFENKKIKAEQEIRNLELQAKEKEEKSKFWLNFSTTYAGQYVEAADKIYGAINLKRAQTFIDDYYTNGDFLENINNLDILDDMSSAEMQKVADKWANDKNISKEELSENFAKLENIKQRKWDLVNKGLVEKFKDSWEQIEYKTLSTVGEKVNIDKDNVSDILIIRGLEILNKAGIPWNSKAGMDFMTFVQGKAIDKTNQKTKQYNFEKHKENVESASERVETAWKSGDKYKLEFAVNDLSRIHSQRYVKANDGTFHLTDLNKKDAFLASIQSLTERGILKDPKYDTDRILAIAHPDQDFPSGFFSWSPEAQSKFEDKRKSWDARSIPGLRDTVYDIIGLGASERKKKKDKVLTSQDVADKSKIEAGIKKKPGEEGHIDLTNIGQVNALRKEYSSSGTGKGLDLLNEASIFANIGKNENGFILNPEAVEDLAKDGKIDEFRKIISWQPEETRDKYNEMLSGLEFAERVGWDKPGIKKHLLAALKKVSGIEDVTDIPSGSDFEELMFDATQLMYSLINDYDGDDTKNDIQKKQAISNDLKDLINNESGIFRRTSVDGKTKWLAYDNDEKDISSETQIRKIVGMGTSNFLKEVELGTIKVLKQDDIDLWERSILKGQNILNPQIQKAWNLVNELWLSQPQGETFKTKTDIFNEILKAQGATFQIPKGEEDKDLWVSNNIGSNIPNFWSMSIEDRQRVACASEIINLGDTKMCLERIAKDEEKRQAIRNNYNYLNQYTEDEIEEMNKVNKVKRKWWQHPFFSNPNPFNK
tara:strand:+ start:1343 stop:3883 length:2541 start_codon:yes stop_codon:yes gene_type:complete